MKQYETPKLTVCSFYQEVVTSSKEMSSYDDTGSWMEGWSNVTGGKN